MERNGLSVGIDLFFGMIMKKFSAATIETVGSFLDTLSEEAFKTERIRLLNLFEAGATEAEMVEAVKKQTSISRNPAAK